MGQEPAELRRDIESRRDDLGETLDAIGDRVSPGRIMERRRNRMANGLSSFKERVIGTVDQGTAKMSDTAESIRDHTAPDAIKRQTTGSPLGAGLVAFGIGFLVAAALPPTDTEADAASRAHDALEPAKDALVDAARNVANDVKQGAADAAQEVKSTASDAAGEIAATTKDSAAATRADAEQAARQS